MGRRRIAQQLEATAVRRKRGKISVAGSAGLACLAREARQGVRRRRRADCQERGKANERKRCEQAATIFDPTEAQPLHRRVSVLRRA